MRYVCLVLLLAVASPVAAADDFNFIKLEQDVRILERRVQDLSLQVESLQQQVTRAGAQPARSTRPAAAANASAAWLNAGNWDRVRSGMKEFEVISILGVPTSMRPGRNGRVLLYAIEIGSSGFLSGSVTLRDGQVTDVARPVLK